MKMRDRPRAAFHPVSDPVPKKNLRTRGRVTGPNGMHGKDAAEG